MRSRVSSLRGPFNILKQLISCIFLVHSLPQWYTVMPRSASNYITKIKDIANENISNPNPKPIVALNPIITYILLLSVVCSSSSPEVIFSGSTSFTDLFFWGAHSFLSRIYHTKELTSKVDIALKRE